MILFNSIFKTKNFDVINYLDKTDISIDEYTLWLDENLPLEYLDKEDLARSYELMSKADIYKDCSS